MAWTPGDDWESRIRATFVDRLRDLRGSESVMHLANRSNVPYSTLSAWLDGRREPGLVGLLSLVQTFGLGSVEELLGPMPSGALGPRKPGAGGRADSD